MEVDSRKEPVTESILVVSSSHATLIRDVGEVQSKMRFAAAVCAAIIALSVCSSAAPNKKATKPPTRQASRSKSKQTLPKEYVPKPIPTGPQVFTQKQLNAKLAKFYHREIVEEYKRVGNRDPKWDAIALEFLESFALYSTKDYSKVDNGRLFMDCRRLIEMGCTDPMVISCCAMYIRNNGDWTQAKRLTQQALEGFKKSRYHKYYARVSAAYITPPPTAGKPQHYVEDEFMLDSLCDGSYKPGEQQIALLNTPNHTRDGQFHDLGDIQHILDGVEKRKGIDPYVRKTLAAQCHMAKGWCYRGIGWASSVTPEGWMKFAKEMKIARGLLVEAYALHPEFPEAPANMIEVVGTECGQPGETTRMWFDRAVAAQVDYGGAYYSYCWYLLPRWGGTMQQIYAFSLECLKTRRFDTDVPWRFIDQMIGFVSNDIDGDCSYWNKPTTWQAVDELLEGYGKSNCCNGADWYRSACTAICYKHGRFKEARKALLAAGTNLDDSAFYRYCREDLAPIKREIMGLGGPAGEEIQKAADICSKKDYDKALECYEKALTKAAGDKASEDFIHELMSLVDVSRHYAKGEWTDLKPPADLNGWSIDGGKWTTAGDGVIDGTPSNGFALTYDPSFENHYEVSVDVEFLGEQKPGTNAGLVFKPVETYTAFMNSVFVSKAEKKVGLLYQASNAWTVSNLDIKDKNTLLVQVWDQHVRVYLNGQMIKQATWSLSKRISQSRIGVGYQYSSSNQRVRFSHLQIRALLDAPWAK